MTPQAKRRILLFPLAIVSLLTCLAACYALDQAELFRDGALEEFAAVVAYVSGFVGLVGAYFAIFNEVIE